MEINVNSLENSILQSLGYNGFFNDRPFLQLDWVEPAWNIERVLLDKYSSPYFHHLYDGPAISEFSFYFMCFYSYICGIEYAVIKNGNLFPQWDYWQMHKNIGDDLLMQVSILWVGIKNRDSLLMCLGGCNDMGQKGIMAHKIIEGAINCQIKEGDKIEDFNIWNDKGNKYNADGEHVDLPIRNLSNVLALFHKIGTVVALEAIMCKDDKDRKDLISWGGQGMTKPMFMYNG